MQVMDWNAVPEERMSTVFSRRVLHTERLTIARVYLAAGCVVPEHAHENEQVSTMEQGRLRFVVAGVEQVLSAGQSLVIPPHVPHSAEALDDCVAVDVFTPRREDWIRGDDAYLRGGSR